MVFNVCTMAIATGLASFAIRYLSAWRPTLAGGPAFLAATAGLFFLANTLPVAAIISLSERTKIFRTWTSILQLSFPYYIAGAGISSMVVTASRRVGWEIPVLVLPVMYAIYRSYQLYFARVMAMSRAAGLIGLDRPATQVVFENGSFIASIDSSI